MATVKDVYNLLNEKAPFEIQMDFDNAGFLVGRGDREVKKVLVSLDITQEVVEEAQRFGAGLIVAHHPVIFHPVRSVTDESPTGRILLQLMENGIAAICAHTNLDAVAEGVNDALARKLGLSEIGQLKQDGVDWQGRPYGIGRTGTVKAMPLSGFTHFVKHILGAGGIRVVDAGKPVHKVAVGGGACADMMGDALAQGCDTFVTADVKYNAFLDAAALGLNLVDAGHFPTENVVCPVLLNWLAKDLPEVEVALSQTHHEIFTCL